MVNQTTADGVATSRGALHVVCTVLHKDIVTGATCSTVDVLKYPPVINWKEVSRPIPVDKNTSVIPPRTTTQVLNGTGPSAPQISIRSHNIESSRRSIIPQEARNAKPLDASINRFMAKHTEPTPSLSNINGRKAVTNKRSDVYTRRWMKFGSDTLFSKNPNFMNFGLSPVNTTNKLGSIIVPTTRVWRPTNGYWWIHPVHDIEEATSDRVIKMKADNHYNFKSDFETMREIQFFERENISMSRPTLDSTPIDMKHKQ